MYWPIPPPPKINGSPQGITHSSQGTAVNKIPPEICLITNPKAYHPSLAGIVNAASVNNAVAERKEGPFQNIWVELLH